MTDPVDTRSNEEPAGASSLLFALFMRCVVAESTGTLWQEQAWSGVRRPGVVLLRYWFVH